MCGVGEERITELKLEGLSVHDANGFITVVEFYQELCHFLTAVVGCKVFVIVIGICIVGHLAEFCFRSRWS